MWSSTGSTTGPWSLTEPQPRLSPGMAEENNQSPFLEPSDHMAEEIARQAEWIFSDTSLGKDTFLLKHVIDLRVLLVVNYQKRVVLDV